MLGHASRLRLRYLAEDLPQGLQGLPGVLRRQPISPAPRGGRQEGAAEDQRTAPSASSTTTGCWSAMPRPRASISSSAIPLFSEALKADREQQRRKYGRFKGKATRGLIHRLARSRR